MKKAKKNKRTKIKVGETVFVVYFFAVKGKGRKQKTRKYLGRLHYNSI